MGTPGAGRGAMADVPDRIASGWRFWAAVVFLAPLALYLAWKDRRDG